MCALLIYAIAPHLFYSIMPIYFLSAFTLQSSPTISRNANLFPRMVMQVMEPLTLLISLLDAVCWVAGGAFIFGAMGRYMQYRNNPSQAPISQTFFLAGIGIILILLPMIGKYALPHN